MRMALPKGRLLEQTLGRLALAGVTFAFSSDRDYTPKCNDPLIRAKVVKVRAIPQLVALGNFQVGFCGNDLLVESGYDEVSSLLDLGLNPVKLVVAVSRDDKDILFDPPKRPLLIATEYESIASQWAMKHGLAHIIIQTWGSTEAYAPEDADIVFDNSETGRTIEANGLVVIDEVVTSSTCLVVNRVSYECEEFHEQIDRLVSLLGENNV